MSPKKIIISGVSGQIGSYMAEYLLENTDHEIIGTIRRTSQLIDSNIKNIMSHKNFRIAHFDLCDSNSIINLIKNEQPNYFFNFGAQTFVSDSWRSPDIHLQTNAVAILHILEAIKNHCPECRIYSSGSSEQWGDVIYSPQNEDHPMRPRSPYGVSKCAAGLYVKVYRESYGLYAVHGIFLNNESQRRQKYFVTRKITSNIARIFHEIQSGANITPFALGNLDAKRDWSHSKDMARGAWMMLNQEEFLEKKLSKRFNVSFNLKSKEKFIPREYVLSSGEERSVREFLEIGFEKAKIEFKKSSNFMTNKNSDYVEYQVKDKSGRWQDAVIISKKYFRPAEVNALLGDSSQIKSDLGWKPEITFEQLIDEMIKFDLESFK